MPTHLAHPSPKRKRDQPPPVPLLNTALRPATTPPPRSPGPSSRPNSPRNEVADQLRGMSLTSRTAIPMSPLTPTDDVIRKKPKLDAMRVDSGTSLNTQAQGEESISRKHGDILDTIAVKVASETPREIPETPQMPQPRILPDIASFAQPTAFVSSPANTSTKKVMLPSQASRSQQRSSSHPRPRKRSPSPPPSVLTWKDSEITGHLADPSTDPDDDGTGINGIGFKPTPALAYARSQKRRQQINEWKARETREARARRSERRRRGVRGTSSREPTVEREMPAKQAETGRRTVKFAV